MKSGLIRPLECIRLLNRADESLPTAWVGQNNTNASMPRLEWLQHGHIDPMRETEQRPVLVSLKSQNEPVFGELLELARAGVRAYVLVPEAWGNHEKVEPLLLQSPFVLIRRMAALPASGILTSNGGRVWLGGPWSLRLNGQQSIALRQTFLRMFWHEAFEEAWTSGKQLVWRVVRDRPFDVPELDAHAPLRVGPSERLQMDVRGASMHLASSEVPAGVPRKLWFCAGAEHHDKLAKLVRQGTEVVWQELALPDIVARENSGELVVSGPKARMRIVLDAQQATDAKRILDLAGSWSFRVDVRIGEPSVRASTFWLRNEAKPRKLQTQQSISVGDILAPSLRNIPDSVPEKWPDADTLALEARYVWQVNPPKLPQDAIEDVLVKRWREIDEQWSERLQRLQEGSLRIAEDCGRLKKTFAGFFAELLGFGQANDRFDKQIDALANYRPSLTSPSDATTKFRQLNELEEDVRRLQQNVEETERRKIEEVERAKQEAAWHERVKTAQEKLAKCREIFPQQEEQLAALEVEVAVADDNLKSVNVHNKNSKNDKKDAYAQKKKMDDELARAKKNVDRLRNEMQSLEESTKEPFEFRMVKQPLLPATVGTARFVPAQNSKTTVMLPEHALPAVGELRMHQKQRYLAIRTWEELDRGEQEALRLEAKLVAMGDV